MWSKNDFYLYAQLFQFLYGVILLKWNLRVNQDTDGHIPISEYLHLKYISWSIWHTYAPLVGDLAALPANTCYRSSLCLCALLPYQLNTTNDIWPSLPEPILTQYISPYAATSQLKPETNANICQTSLTFSILIRIPIKRVPNFIFSKVSSSVQLGTVQLAGHYLK